MIVALCACVFGGGGGLVSFLFVKIYGVALIPALINISELWGGLARFFHVGMVPAACGNVETLHSTG